MLDLIYKIYYNLKIVILMYNSQTKRKLKKIKRFQISIFKIRKRKSMTRWWNKLIKMKFLILKQWIKFK